ncbi:hypothetical protein NDU88_007678 [Pleurodeles waltl]|uniref:Uncharacterized protein n=1 Tax=Pleurodeles waltl TaxID=8319 RepID=A0AAV7VUH9_PLEWA|nr:hypothetical protein NDU88_007678 [Pleurodeles waltl]
MEGSGGAWPGRRARWPTPSEAPPGLGLKLCLLLILWTAAAGAGLVVPPRGPQRQAEHRGGGRVRCRGRAPRGRAWCCPLPLACFCGGGRRGAAAAPGNCAQPGARVYARAGWAAGWVAALMALVPWLPGTHWGFRGPALAKAFLFGPCGPSAALAAC